MVFKATTLVVGALAFTLATGCKDDPKPQAIPPATAESEDDHAEGISIGQKTEKDLTFTAKQAEPVEAGGEGAFDLAISGFKEGQKPKAVRLWVGLDTAKGSVKALAEEEEEKPGVWHAHVEVPEPLPEGAKFWAEVEPATGEAIKVSFDLAK